MKCYYFELYCNYFNGISHSFRAFSSFVKNVNVIFPNFSHISANYYIPIESLYFGRFKTRFLSLIRSIWCFYFTQFIYLFLTFNNQISPQQSRLSNECGRLYYLGHIFSLFALVIYTSDGILSYSKKQKIICRLKLGQRDAFSDFNLPLFYIWLYYKPFLSLSFHW